MSSNLLRSAWLGLLDGVLPQTCSACGEWIPSEAPGLCDACAADIEIAQRVPYCPRCGRTALPITLDAHGCARCRHEHAWNVGAVARVGPYRAAPLRRLLLNTKFGGNERSAACLARNVAATLRLQPWLSDLDAFIPVPMHRLRRWQRPCEHARLLAEHVWRELRHQRMHTPRVLQSGIRRVRYAESQMWLPSRQRRFDNVRGCFSAASATWLRGRTVCIVDNLMTSGATVIELSKALRKAGARRVYAVVAARASVADEAQPAAFAAPDGAGDGEES